MKVNIGPYRNWVGPYQVANVIQKFGFSEEHAERLGGILSRSWIGNALEWIHAKKKRSIKVKIHEYDTWSADHTLALIILPLMKQLKETNHGAPSVDPKDVPENLRDTAEEIAAYNSNGTTSDKFFARWNWVMDEIIFSFEMKLDEDWMDKFYTDLGESDFIQRGELFELTWIRKPVVDNDGLRETQTRITNGFALFGKYYESLWD